MLAMRYRAKPEPVPALMELAFYWPSMQKSNIYMFKNCNCDKRCEGEFKNARKICNSMFEGWGCGWAGTLPWGDLRINQEKGGKGVCYRQGTACAKARQGSKQIRNAGSRRKGPGVSWGWAGGRQADPAGSAGSWVFCYVDQQKIIETFVGF